ncbi:MAG: TIR domain-containing protein [Chitinophagaceae bacterium]|nr:TIR domain-containing protein [Chitinophagaceae bacterium]
MSTKGKKISELSENYILVDNMEELLFATVMVSFSEDDYEAAPKGISYRYFWDGKELGIHIVDENFTDADWEELKTSLSTKFETLQVLYLSATGMQKMSFKDLRQLKQIFLNNNKNLETLELKNVPSLQIVEVACCRQLYEVNIIGDFPILEKFDISVGQVETILWDCAILPKLFYLNVQKNKLTELNLEKMPALKYVFARGNAMQNILYPKSLDEISIIEVDTTLIADEDEVKFLQLTDLDLQQAIRNKFMRKASGTVAVYRIKLILLGNTTVGKTSLRKILLSPKGKENKAATFNQNSTHGVYIFNKTYQTKDGKTIYMQGFDFGGQDYYHAAHLPYYDHHALNVLVYGFGEDIINPEKFTAYQFGLKLKPKKLKQPKDPFKQNEDDDEETIKEEFDIVYPIPYWVGSLKNKAIVDWYKARQNKIANFLSSQQEQEMEIKQDTSEEILIIPQSKLELIQNKRANHNLLELDNFSLKNNPEVKIGDIAHFEFVTQGSKVKDWLEEKIYKYGVTRETSLATLDFELGQFFQKKANKVLFSKEDLIKLPEVKKTFDLEPTEYIGKTDDEKEAIRMQRLTNVLESLHNYQFGYFFNPDKNMDSAYFIANQEKFSKWIHNDILSESKALKHGYILRTDILKIVKNPCEGNLDEVLRFLMDQHILFRVKGNENKWVAPSYLPPLKRTVDRLLLESFDLPDCTFTFKEYFHSNILLMIIDHFEKRLVSDQGEKKFLLWKNKVLLHETPIAFEEEPKEGDTKPKGYKNLRREKAYLLIELKYPGMEGFEEEYPQLCISRNQSGYIKDSNFKEVFKFIYDYVFPFNPDIQVKTRFHNYIPYESILQHNSKEHKEKSDLIFHNNTFYSKYDFRLYLPDIKEEPTKIFIAYSRHDLAYVEELVLHLRPHELRGDVVVFYDKRLSVAEKWDEETKHHLVTSDVVVCMVSPEMLATEIVTQVELPLAQEEGIPIAPIVLRSCDWTHLELNKNNHWFGDHNAFDKANVLPSDRYSREQEWMLFAEQLKRRVKRSRKGG